MNKFYQNTTALVSLSSDPVVLSNATMSAADRIKESKKKTDIILKGRSVGMTTIAQDSGEFYRAWMEENCER